MQYPMWRLMKEGDGGDPGAAGDGKGAADAGKPAGGVLDQAGQDAATKAAADAAAAKAAEGKPQRPDWMPEQWWDAEKNAPKLEDAAKSWKDTRTALKTAQDDLKKAKGIPLEGVPESAEGYKLEQPPDTPEQYQLPNDDPGLASMRKSAFEAGLTQGQFSKMVNGLLAAVKDSGGIKDPVKEVERLGPNGKAIANAVWVWGEQLKNEGLWSEEEFRQVVVMGSTAEGIIALNKLRERYGGERPIPTDGAKGKGLPSKEEVYAKVADPRYKTDAAFRTQVDREFEQVFGRDESGRSQNGLGIR